MKAGSPAAKYHLDVLWWATRIPAMPPRAPPASERPSKVASGNLLPRSIAVRRFNRRADVNARGTAQTHRAERLEATMAHATRCAAPEGNRGRDEWMTVIEMQEYMGASRSKAYDLIWPGEIDSYRLGRKLLVSTAPGAARGRAREGASRREELEDDHDQEH